LITASTLVVDDAAQKVLLTLHPRFGRWLQLGGHCEDTDVGIRAAALREATARWARNAASRRDLASGLVEFVAGKL
jgi:8-oxo-dGTP pyrophosphatase MutT (NUDIX family)